MSVITAGVNTITLFPKYRVLCAPSFRQKPLYTSVLCCLSAWVRFRRKSCTGMSLCEKVPIVERVLRQYSIAVACNLA